MSFILSGMWGFVWAVLSSKFGITYGELAFWLPLVFGSVLITATVKN